MLRKPELSTGPMGHLGPYKGFTFYQWWIGYFDLSKLLPLNGNSMYIYALFQTHWGRRPLDGLASCSNGSTSPLTCIQPTPDTLRTACDCFIWHKDKKKPIKGTFWSEISVDRPNKDDGPPHSSSLQQEKKGNFIQHLFSKCRHSICNLTDSWTRITFSAL